MSASWYARMVCAADSMAGQSRNHSGPGSRWISGSSFQQLAVESQDPFDFFGEVLVRGAVAPLYVPDHALAVRDLRGQALVGQLPLQTTRLHAGPKFEPCGVYWFVPVR